MVYFLHASKDMDRNRFTKAAALLGIVVFLIGIALFIYAGSYSRYWADDYCYSAVVKQLGLFRGLVNWYDTSGNRLSALAVVAFTEIFGWKFIRFTTLVILALWVGAWIFFLSQVRRLVHWKVSGYWLVLLALVEVYFAALLAPDRLQSIYWRMGTFHYTLPLPLLLIELGLFAVGYQSSGKKLFWAVALSTFITFFSSGLSETFAAMQAGAFSLAMIAGLISLPGQQGVPRPQRGQVARLLAAPLAATILMMAIMSQAPANEWRQAVMPPPENLLLVIPYSLRYAGDFIYYTMRGQILPFLIYIITVGIIALLAVPAERANITLPAGLAYASAALLGMYALIVCSFAPSAYAGLLYRQAGR